MLECRGEYTPLPAGIVLLTDMHSKPVNPHLYCRIVGKLIFLTTTRPDLAYVVSSVSRFMTQPQEPHMDAVKHILRYVKHTIDYGLSITLVTHLRYMVLLTLIGRPALRRIDQHVDFASPWQAQP
jgi:hypothetical protein